MRPKSSAKSSIEVKGASITILKQPAGEYLSLTDIARFKNPDHTDDVIRNWLRNRSTVEFLGIWERLNNPDFNPVEFDGIRFQTGLNSFVLTPKQWVEKPQAEGNATLEQLVVLTNLESMNSVLIRQGLTSTERLQSLNQTAIAQMKTLLRAPAFKQLKGGKS